MGWDLFLNGGQQSCRVKFASDAAELMYLRYVIDLFECDLGKLENLREPAAVDLEVLPENLRRSLG